MSEIEQSDCSTSKFVVKDGCTYYNGKRFGDFCLKIVGEVHEPTRRNAIGMGEGKWLVSATGFVFSKQYTRLITLSGSCFDGKKQLLDALRGRFPGGTINIDSFVSNVWLSEYWQSLLQDYRNVFTIEAAPRIAYTTTYLGHQSIPNSNTNNYWFLGPQLHVEDNSMLIEDSYKVFEASNTDGLFPFATTINQSLLKLPNLLDATKSLIRMARYFDINAQQFKLSVSFVAARLLRSHKVDETWGESNIGLIFSGEKNCGKSLTLRTIAKLQGLSDSHHPMLLAGGNQNTAGTSGKKVLETLCKSSLVALVDDPLISKNLGEFLNQAQSGLAQGSTKSGLMYPKGSLLMTSNTKEVQRIEGRVIRFDYLFDKEHDDQYEGQLTKFFDDNKGLLVAWCMRFLPVHEKIAEAVTGELKALLKRCLPKHQVRWIKGITHNFLTYAMLHASVNEKPHLADAIEKLVESNISVTREKTLIERLQVDLYQLLKKNKGNNVSSLTWINPLPKVKSVGNENWEKAIAIKTSTIGKCDNVSWTEVKNEITTLTSNGWEQRSVCFAKNNEATLPDVRTKRNTTLITTGGAFKIPQRVLDPLFVEWINYVTGNGLDIEPEEDYLTARLEFEDVEEMDSKLSAEDLEVVEQIEQTILTEVQVYCKRVMEGNEVESPSDLSPCKEYVKYLSPSSKQLYNSFTPTKKHSFAMGVIAAKEAEKLARENLETLSSNTSPTTSGESTSTSNIQTPMRDCSQPPPPPKKRLKFAEGAFGVLETSRRGNNKDACPCGNTEEVEGQMWIECNDCKQWYHLDCTELQSPPSKFRKWFCTRCSASKGNGKKGKTNKN